MMTDSIQPQRFFLFFLKTFKAQATTDGAQHNGNKLSLFQIFAYFACDTEWWLPRAPDGEQNQKLTTPSGLSHN